MKDRILQIMKHEGMTQQEFANALEISPASLSNIFNGKTNPTNNHVNAIHRRFPNININWLMFGEGSMYSDEVHSQNGDTGFITPDAVAASASSYRVADIPADSGSMLHEQPAVPSGSSPYTFMGEMAAAMNTAKYMDKPQRKITEIRIFFDDGTFETFYK